MDAKVIYRYLILYLLSKIMFNIIDCDVYLSTPEFFKQKILGNLELTKKLGKLAPRKSRGVTSEIVKEILENKDRTLLSSTRKEGSECKVVVGQVSDEFSMISRELETMHRKIDSRPV